MGKTKDLKDNSTGLELPRAEQERPKQEKSKIVCQSESKKEKEQHRSL